MNPAGGRGYFGWGRGRGGAWGGGRGRRNGFYATGLPGWQRFGAGYPAFGGAMPYGAASYGAAPAAPTRDQELDALKGQAEYFEDALEGIKKRISELEAESDK